GFDQGNDAYPAGLAFIRVEPVSAVPPEPAPPAVRHPLVITNDGHGIFGSFPHSRPEDLLEEIEQQVPRNTCMRMLLWGAGDADQCNYPTRVGNRFATEAAVRSPFHRTLYGNMKRWRDNQWDSLKTVRDYARARNWEFQVY